MSNKHVKNSRETSTMCDNFKQDIPKVLLIT